MNKQKDLAAGALVGLLGLGFCIAAASSLPIGTATAMGPGYFPIALGGILILLGVVIAFQTVDPEELKAVPVPWRGLSMTLGAVVFFGLAQSRLGLVPTLMITILLASYASRGMKLKVALSMAILLTAFCAAVFKYGLSMPLDLFGSWIGG